MRFTKLSFTPMLSLLLACGGGGGDPDASVDASDAEVPMDASDAGPATPDAADDAGTPPRLLSLAVDAAELSFDPETFEYDLPVAYLWTEAVVTATVDDGSTIEIQGAPVESGRPSDPIALDEDENIVAIELTRGAESTTYTLTLERLGAAYLKASNAGAGDQFGAIARDGDVIVVGAPAEASDGSGPDDDSSDVGAAYVFRRVDGEWTEEAYLKPSDAATHGGTMRFGASVAVHAERIFVGAPGHGPDLGSQPVGAIYVFERSGDSWSEVDRITDGEVHELGWSLAVSEDVLVAGTPRDSHAALDPSTGSATLSGAVSIFRFDGSEWRFEARLKQPDPASQDYFGVSVDIDGNWLVVGADREDGADTGLGGDPTNDDATDSGAAYLYRFDGSAWALEEYLKATNAQSFDRFGNSVAIEDEWLVVGARDEDGSATGVGGADSDDASNAGAAYVFRLVDDAWSEHAYVKAPNTGAGDRFGYRVAIGDGLIAIGAPYEAGAGPLFEGDPLDDSVAAAGAVYVLRFDGAAWAHERYAKAIAPAEGDFFGEFLAIGRDGLAVGSTYEDGGLERSGAAWVY